MDQAFVNEQNRLQAEYQALLNQQAQQAEEEARLAPLIEAVKREDESDWHNLDLWDGTKRVVAGALPIAGTILGGLAGTPLGPAGIGAGALLGSGLTSLAGTGLSSEIAKSDAYEYQKALNALNEARGQGISQTPEEASEIARQNTGLWENKGNTALNLGFDVLGGEIAGGGLKLGAKYIGKLIGKEAGEQQVGKILGKMTIPERFNRPVDYAVNATQAGTLPLTQENAVYDGDFTTQESQNPLGEAGMGALGGLGFSALGHAGSAMLNRFANGGVPQMNPNQQRLDAGAEPQAEQAVQEVATPQANQIMQEPIQEATQKPVSMLQGLFDKINLGKPQNDYIGAYDVQKSNVVPEQNVTPEKFQLPTGIDNSEQLLRQQEIQGFINRAKDLQREAILSGELDDKQFTKTQTPTNIMGLVEQKLGRPPSEEEQIELLNNPSLIRAIMAESEFSSPNSQRGFMANSQGFNLRNQVADILNPAQYETGISKSSDEIAGYLPSREIPLLETGKFDPKLANNQIATSKKLAQKERIAGLPNDKQFVKPKTSEPSPMEYKAKGVKDLPKKGEFKSIEKDIASKTKETAKKLEAFKKANAKKKDK